MVLGTRVPVAHIAAVQADGGVQVPAAIVRVPNENLRVGLSCVRQPLAHLLFLEPMAHATDARPHGLGVQSVVSGQHVGQQFSDAREGNETRQLRLQIEPLRRDQAGRVGQR
jgi:hypothetical protein